MISDSLTLAELADLVGGQLVHGDKDRSIRKIAPTDGAGADAVTFVADRRFLPALATSSAAAVLLDERALDSPRPPQMAVIVVPDPYEAFARAAQRLSPRPPQPAPGIHSTAHVDPGAELGDGVAVGAFAYVGSDVVVGNRTVLHAGVHLEPGVRIGADSVLYNRVVVRHGCRIGAACIVHPGAVIGADGFGFARPKVGSEPVKIPQTGGVVIEDEVEIGANACIDRGTFGDTRIGRSAKIDNLVQIGHNVTVEPGCILVAQSGVAGSSRIKSGAILGAQSGVSGHLTVGERAVVYGQAGVMRDVQPRSQVAGSPAEPRTSFFRRVLMVRKLDEWGERVRELERAVRAVTTGHDQTQP